METLELIGIVVLAIVTISFFGIVFALIGGYILIKTDKTILPEFVLMLINIFYLPAKTFSKLLGFDELFVENVVVKLSNLVGLNQYRKIPKSKRAVVLPQCLRDLMCPAKLDPLKGILCQKCGRCTMGEIVKLGEKIKTGVYILPGGSFTKKIIGKFKPKALLAVACPPQLHKGLLLTSVFKIPTLVVPLDKTGCVNTSVNFEEIKKKMLL